MLVQPESSRFPLQLFTPQAQPATSASGRRRHPVSSRWLLPRTGLRCFMWEETATSASGRQIRLWRNFKLKMLLEQQVVFLLETLEAMEVLSCILEVILLTEV